MKFFPIRYWWTGRTGERTATTVGSGTDAEDALRRFRADHPHLGRAAVIPISKPAPRQEAVPCA